ncbi:MAG TPA: ABC transporter permease [Candidatus Angelobacter sp.]
METFWRDLKYGIRTLARTPGFTAIAVLTLALGIGANTAIFSVVHSVLLAPLPYLDPDQLVIIWEKIPPGRFISPSYPDVQDWQRSSHSFQAITAFTTRSFDLSGASTAAHLDGWLISAAFFRTLGVAPILGREFSTEEDQPGAAHVAMISLRLWRDRFSGARDAIGKTLTLDGASYTIVGVLPPGINLGGTVDVCTPLGQADPLVINDRRTHAFVAIARLKPGTTIALAESDMSAVQKHLGELYPKFDQGLGAGVVSLKKALVDDVSGTLLMLLGAVGLVLLIACANVASLLLARAAGREKEFALRAALGAPRARIVGQMVTESVVLSLAGGGLGLALAWLGVKPVLAAVPAEIPRVETVGVHAAVLLFTFAISVVVGIIFGLLPALKLWRGNQQPSLQHAGRGFTREHHRTQRSFVVVQTALTMVLLVCGGLLLRTMMQLSRANPGFETRDVLSFKMALAPQRSSTPQAMRRAYQEMIGRIQAIPGVRSADLTTLLPLSGVDNGNPFWVGPNEPSSIAEAPRGLLYWVGPDYFQAMGIPLLRGRSFTPADNLQSAQVGIIDTTMADKYFPGQDPLGKNFTLARVGSFRIVGVVGHVKHWSLGNQWPYERVQIYTPFYQLADQWLAVMHPLTTVVLRTQLAPASLMPAIKAAVYGSGDEQPIYDVQTMQQRAATSMGPQRFPMVLLAIFAALALVLASVGIYGLLAYLVQQRTREVGIRMALGAQQRDVFRMIVGHGLKMTLAGIAIGVASSIIFARLLSSFSRLLYGVRASDPLTFALAGLLLSLTATLACYIPARRATRVVPTEALRQE